MRNFEVVFDTFNLITVSVEILKVNSSLNFSR